MGGRDIDKVCGTDAEGVDIGLFVLVPVFGGSTESVIVASSVELRIGVDEKVGVICLVGVGGGVSVRVTGRDELAVIDGVGGGSKVAVWDTLAVGRDMESV